MSHPEAPKKFVDQVGAEIANLADAWRNGSAHPVREFLIDQGRRAAEIADKCRQMATVLEQEIGS